MTPKEIVQQRMLNQQLAHPNSNNIVQVVKFMAGMQAQDFPMSKWAVGSRLSGISEQDIEASYNRGEIIRTHVMRPTWHLVCAEDLYWMIDLTAPQMIQSMKSRWKELEITDFVLKKCYRLIENTLNGGKTVTREELVKEFEKAGIATENNRSSHLLVCAELKKIICSGPLNGKKITYASFPERIPDARRLTKEESLAELARRYFVSRGPATLDDFTWWSGLTRTDAKIALESVKDSLVSETLENRVYWFSGYDHSLTSPGGLLHLLPAFDEFIISYKDRSACLPQEHFRKAVSNNGIFWPTVVKEGKIIGVWKRTIKKERVRIEVNFFRNEKPETRKRVSESAESYATFLNKTPELFFN